jgi:Fur family zinc uptake transcriptional regulator
MKKNHDHKQCSKKVIKNAEEVCDEGSLNLTPIRKKVLEIIASNHKPARAYDILSKLKDKGFSDKPPTVYRALNFLMENRMVHKLNTINAYVACFNNEVEEISCFLICEKCQNIEEFQDKGIAKAMAVWNPTRRGKKKVPPLSGIKPMALKA